MPEIMQQQPKPRGRRKKIRTEPIRPICPQCEKQFSNQSALTKHKLTHSDERKFACQQCSKAFKRHDHLTGHMQTHSNRKPFNCTVQGCDKTYCDARSLRRHKENIHHITTPKESQHQHEHQHQHQHQHQNQRQHEHQHQRQQLQPQQQQQQQPQQVVTYQQQQHNSTVPPSPSSTTSPNSLVHQHEPLRRGIQRFNSDPGASYQAASMASAPVTDPNRRLVDHFHPSAQNQHHNQQQQHYHHPQASYSADYATTQQFSFEFDHIQPTTNHNNHNNHLRPNHNQVTSSGYVTPTQPGSAMADFATNTQNFFDFNNNDQLTSIDQQFTNGASSIAHSAESLTDSSLGLSIQYEQQTPLTDGSLQQLTQTGQEYEQQQQHQTYQQPAFVPPPSFSSPSVQHEPTSHLFQRRIQRFNSHSGASHNHHTATILDPNRRLVDHINPSAQSQHNQQHYHHHHPQASYSADYATTQQFSFEFDHIQAPMANNHHHHNNNQHLNHSHSNVTSSGYVTPTQPGSAIEFY